MSATLINRSLTSIRTELEFLKESKVITPKNYDIIQQTLPSHWEDTLKATPTAPEEYVEAIYPYKPEQQGDLELKLGDKIRILEKPSPEWYKGSSNGKVGIFPVNYTRPAFAEPQNLSRRKSPMPPPSVDAEKQKEEEEKEEEEKQREKEKKREQEEEEAAEKQRAKERKREEERERAMREKQSQAYYQRPPSQSQMVPSAAGAPVPYGAPPPQQPQQGYYQQPQYGQPQPQPQYAQQQPQYVQPQQQPVQQQQPQQVQQQQPQQPRRKGPLRKAGGKLGNAALFGAGATIGSNIVNSIF